MPPETAGEDFIGWDKPICHAAVPSIRDRAAGAPADPVRAELPRKVGQSSAWAVQAGSDSKMDKTAKIRDFFITISP
jgi:hypothetical protein